MSLAVPLGLLVGAALGWGAWLALAPVWDSEVLSRSNFRGRKLPVGGGLVLVVAVQAGVAGLVAWRIAISEFPGLRPADLAGVMAVLGFGLLGFIDDLLGGSGVRGLRGHLREAVGGRITTGMLKLAGGFTVALLCVAVVTRGSAVQTGIDVLLVAAAANLANLFDLAPGRAIKVAIPVFVALVLAWGSGPALLVPAVVVGAALALLVPDLRERIMLGDTGANPLGAVLGLAVVVSGTASMRVAVCAVVVLLNVLSEFVSFGRLIDRVPPLRLADRIGRRS